MAREAKTIITAIDKTAEGISSAIRSFGGMGDAASKLGAKIVDAFSVLAVIEAGRKIVEFGADAVRTFGEVERTMTQLSTALGGNQASISRATELMGYMSSRTLESKDSVEKLIAEMASLGKSDEDMDKLGRAALALSNVTGKDLQSSFTLINATYTGTSGKLARLIPEIGDLSKAQLEAGGAVDLLNAKLGAISDSMGEGISQKISNLTKGWEDFKEAIGADLAPIFSPIVEWITSIVNEWALALDGARNHREYNKLAAEERTAQMELEERRYQLKKANENVIIQEAEIRSVKSQGGDPNISGDTKRLQDFVDEQHRLTQEIAAFKREIDAAGNKLKKPIIPPPGPGSPLDNSLMPSAPLYLGGTRTGDPNPQGIGWIQPLEDYVHETISRMEGIGSGGSSSGNVGGGMPFSLPGQEDNPIMDILSKVGSSFGSMFTSLASVQQILNPIQTILSAMFEVIGPLINEALAPLVGLLKMVGHALGVFLVPIIEFLGKTIKGVIMVIAAVWNAIADAINWALGWLGVKVGKWTLADTTAAGTTPVDSTSPKASGASYTGSQSITFNFYNQSPVVGDGGLRELSLIIKSILAKEARYA